MIVAIIDHHDLKYILAEQSIKIDDRFAFTKRHIDIFLKIMWDKYDNGEARDCNRLGTRFGRVEIDEFDIARIVASITVD